MDAVVILFDPIFQGLAISLTAGEIATLLLWRMTVPVVHDRMWRRDRTAPHRLAATAVTWAVAAEAVPAAE